MMIWMGVLGSKRETCIGIWMYIVNIMCKYKKKIHVQKSNANKKKSWWSNGLYTEHWTYTHKHTVNIELYCTDLLAIN